MSTLFMTLSSTDSKPLSQPCTSMPAYCIVTSVWRAMPFCTILTSVAPLSMCVMPQSWWPMTNTSSAPSSKMATMMERMMPPKGCVMTAPAFLMNLASFSRRLSASGSR